MSEVDSLIKQGMTAFKAGQKEEAKNLFMQAVDKDERSEQAWLWLSAVVDTDEERQICLENVLAVNPDNERARKGLDMVNQKLGAAPSAPKPAEPPPPAKPAAPPPPRSSAPIGAEFASSSGDNFFGGFDQPAANDNSSFEQPITGSFDWFTGGASEPAAQPPQQDFFGSPTSVDWGSSGGTKPAAHGSGKDVPQPSPQEYDSWAQNLPLDPAKSEDSFSTSFAVDSSTPFGDTSFMAGSDDFGAKAPDDPFAGLPTTNPNDPFGRGAFGVDSFPWDEPPAESKPKTNPPSARMGQSSAAFGSAFEDDPFTDTSGGAASGTFGGFPFADEAEGEGELDFDFDAPEQVAGAPVFGTQKQGVKTDDYFQYIPAEIEAKAGGGLSSRSLAMLGGVVALVVLNLISLVMLFSAL